MLQNTEKIRLFKSRIEPNTNLLILEHSSWNMNDLIASSTFSISRHGIKRSIGSKTSWNYLEHYNTGKNGKCCEHDIVYRRHDRSVKCVQSLKKRKDKVVKLDIHRNSYARIKVNEVPVIKLIHNLCATPSHDSQEIVIEVVVCLYKRNHNIYLFRVNVYSCWIVDTCSYRMLFNTSYWTTYMNHFHNSW